jgi:Uncharacterised nucleotidyltransferase
VETPNAIVPFVANMDFYRNVIRLLATHGIEYLVGGGYAFGHYTGLQRDTKDLDIVVRPRDLSRVLTICEAAGYRTKLTSPHWLAKVFFEEDFVDIIFNSGNGVCRIDEAWFVRAREAEFLETQVRIIPPEEMIWQKAFIMERERFDGADVAHLLLNCAQELDWKHLVDRFDLDWRLLLSHLLLFGYIYPSRKKMIPRNVVSRLLSQLIADETEPATASLICNGTLLSRGQFLYDVGVKGFLDARLGPRRTMTQKDIESWTLAAAEESHHRDTETRR